LQAAIEFIKKEIVLIIALLLAAVSMFFVTPDAEYAGYLDYQTLALLFCLMIIMAKYQHMGFFKFVAVKLLENVNGSRQLCAALIMLCFFFSMIITNDVALITFVPFAITVLKMADLENKMIPVIVLQTVAANLGSMLTPIGNPQNLYLYAQSGMGTGSFVLLMLPYTLISLVLLVTIVLIMEEHDVDTSGLAAMEDKKEIHVKPMVIYSVMFAGCLLAVAGVIPWQAMLAAVAVLTLITDAKLLIQVDYSLLLTFVGFFIFIGNMGRIPEFSGFLMDIVQGNEVLTAVAASQVISNVPAALLLSGFTSEWSLLIIGTNLGGLGTLIASMASLISYKQVVQNYPEKRRKYTLHFTVTNICFLAVLLVACWLIVR
jgi:Na+/H+ antiporter NhaD/arsenite permease-like protein